MAANGVNVALQLLLTLTGVTLLFACAQANGTMEGAARQSLRLCRGRTSLLPLLFFCLAALLAMAGPGAILSTALVAPFAMSTGARAGVPVFLVALMVANGANAGNLSPFSTVGVIVNSLMLQAGLGGHEYRVWFLHATATCAVAAAAWFLFGGLTLFRSANIECPPPPPPLPPRHALTLAVTAAWIAAVVFYRAPLGPAAILAAAVLFLFRVASPRDAVLRMPWKTIALVVSISTAVSFLERAGGLRWFQDLITRVATPRTVHPVLAALTGLISAYSSTSGVVLPAFLPLAPGLSSRLPGVDPLALSITINIGSSLVDVSPLSTLGALCIAAAPPTANVRRLYRDLLLWGFAMVPVGALFCFLLWN
jgi:hypothetical protein